MYRADDLIRKKRDGGALDPDEIRWLIAGYASGAIPDYQMSAWLMAVYFRGMTRAETAALTRAMIDSGRRVDLSAIPGVKADKHSTGGVGDKTTLVLAPLVAAAGLKVAKLSGRGLGHTGGTLDKLESIPGFRVDLPPERFLEQVRDVGLAVAGQGPDLVPADGKIYALRDVTATVDSVPLIASSVMAKKIAGGADVIVLDVKVGRGAFMADLESGRALARAMLEIAAAHGRRAAAILSSMDQPLGRAVGNALEVREALETLAGGGPADLRALCLELGARLLVLAGAESGVGQARGKLERLLAEGAALRRFAAMVAAQGGDARVVEDPGLLPAAPVTLPVTAPASGHVQRLDALEVGRVAVALGAGRAYKGQPVDPAVGVVLARKVGDAVAAGDPLATVHARRREDAERAAARLREAYHIGPEPVAPPPLLLDDLMPEP